MISVGTDDLRYYLAICKYPSVGMPLLTTNKYPFLLPQILGDKEIRFYLKQRLYKASSAPKAILEELRVHNGNAIADVVALHRHAHCYEIKSDKDSIERAQKQAQFYDLVFPKITLVTTARHAEKALSILPQHWGVMIAKGHRGKITFGHLRPAGVNRSYCKQLALLTLWKSELTAVAEPFINLKLQKLSRQKISGMLADVLNSEELSAHISFQLAARSALN